MHHSRRGAIVFLIPLLLLTLVLGAVPAQAARLTGRAATTTPTIVYASVKGAGIFKSADLGSPWQSPATLPDDAAALAAGDASHWRVVYAGLAHGGVYISRDGGATWSQTGLRDRAIYALALDPHNPSIIVAATDRGIFASADGGTTWSTGSGLSGTIHSVTAGASGVFYAGGDGHAWTSGDGGKHWSALGRGLPSHAAVLGLAVSATTPITLYAATSQGLWQEGNNTWSQLRHGVSNKRFVAVASDSGHIWAIASGDNGLYVSTDGGATWTHRAISGLSGGATTLVPDAQTPGVIVVGDANGDVESSADGGTTWSASSGAVAGSVGNAILALALVQRQPLPVDGVANPNVAGTRWFGGSGTGHTLRGAFLTFWQNTPSSQSIIGQPLTEEFADQDHGGATAQVFERMELLQQGNSVVPAPLGADLAPSAYISATTPYTVDSHFADFWTTNGGAGFFGPPVSPAFKQSIGDGTGQLYLVQYFRNARLEYHPEVAGVGNVVQVGRLGVLALQRKGWLPVGQ